MDDQVSQNDRNLQRNTESDKLQIVSTSFGVDTIRLDRYTQNLKITGTLHHEWKRKNLLGDFDFFMEGDLRIAYP